MESKNEIKTDSIANWFGTDGKIRAAASRLLAGCNWIGVGFAGGMGILGELKCNQGVATDLHGHVVNLAMVLADQALSDQLQAILDPIPLNQYSYDLAVERCRAKNAMTLLSNNAPSLADVFNPAAAPTIPDVYWAADYYCVSWMGRASKGGTPGEFVGGNISVRWKATGGSSSSRWRSAVDSIPGYRDILKRWTFYRMDAFDFLDQCFETEQEASAKQQELKNGLYLDPPFPGPGDKYTHTLTATHQAMLARSANRFVNTRVVMRFHDCETVRQLYPAGRWHYLQLAGVAQSNEARPEVLITNFKPAAA